MTIVTRSRRSGNRRCDLVQTKRSRRMLAGAEAQARIENHDGLIFARAFFAPARLDQQRSPISMGLKCRFHDSAQSSRFTLAMSILPAPICNPQSAICFSPAEISRAPLLAKISVRNKPRPGSSVFQIEISRGCLAKIAPSIPPPRPRLPSVVATEIRQSGLFFMRADRATA